ncbi:hypothetical protein Rhopal_005634-T1 [Rhodotorula paludigena]|uniref:Uncharacterized protein n=1 Tax=Rhodotorula paludigena TaxID=86838 RepID=A0AAV5GTN6_9BASI|nr:hypothetical protein Rhopal_005634-T1 [Rhodotorula paludigena]
MGALVTGTNTKWDTSGIAKAAQQLDEVRASLDKKKRSTKKLNKLEIVWVKGVIDSCVQTADIFAFVLLPAKSIQEIGHDLLKAYRMRFQPGHSNDNSINFKTLAEEHGIMQELLPTLSCLIALVCAGRKSKKKGVKSMDKEDKHIYENGLGLNKYLWVEMLKEGRAPPTLDYFKSKVKEAAKAANGETIKRRSKSGHGRRFTAEAGEVLIRGVAHIAALQGASIDLEVLQGFVNKVSKYTRTGRQVYGLWLACIPSITLARQVLLACLTELVLPHKHGLVCASNHEGGVDSTQADSAIGHDNIINLIDDPSIELIGAAVTGEGTVETTAELEGEVDKQEEDLQDAQEEEQETKEAKDKDRSGAGSNKEHGNEDGNEDGDEDSEEDKDDIVIVSAAELSGANVGRQADSKREHESEDGEAVPSLKINQAHFAKVGPARPLAAYAHLYKPNSEGVWVPKG